MIGVRHEADHTRTDRAVCLQHSPEASDQGRVRRELEADTSAGRTEVREQLHVSVHTVRRTCGPEALPRQPAKIASRQVPSRASDDPHATGNVIAGV